VTLLLAAIALVTASMLVGCANQSDESNTAGSSAQPAATSPRGSGPAPDRAASSAESPATASTGTTAVPAPEPGEAPERPPFTLLGTTTTTQSPAGSEAERVATVFLTGYWSDTPRTYGQLADVLAPSATERFLQDYRDPARAAEPVNGGQARHVDQITAQATQAANGTATVAGRGLAEDPTSGPRVLQRNLILVLGADGAWRVDSIQ
jgi:hypothetical protein